MILYKHHFSTPIGKMHSLATDKGLVLLGFEESLHLEKQLHTIQRVERVTGITEKLHPFHSQTEQEITAYLNGSSTSFSVPLQLVGTDFQLAVWTFLQSIPYGKTYSYEQQSIAMKQALAIRAIASANGMNPIAIMIPCHRVVGKNGSLTGYAGGKEKKKWLLQHEQIQLGKTAMLF